MTGVGGICQHWEIVYIYKGVGPISKYIEDNGFILFKMRVVNLEKREKWNELSDIILQLKILV